MRKALPIMVDVPFSSTVELNRQLELEGVLPGVSFHRSKERVFPHQDNRGLH